LSRSNILVIQSWSAYDSNHGSASRPTTSFADIACQAATSLDVFAFVAALMLVLLWLNRSSDNVRVRRDASLKHATGSRALPDSLRGDGDAYNLAAALVVAGLGLAAEGGVIAIALNYVPFIGPLIATVFPTLFASRTVPNSPVPAARSLAAIASISSTRVRQHDDGETQHGVHPDGEIPEQANHQATLKCSAQFRHLSIKELIARSVADNEATDAPEAPSDK
jgi:hypothetical protein